MNDQWAKTRPDGKTVNYTYEEEVVRPSGEVMYVLKQKKPG
jgi:hypothetical protein